MNYLFLWFVKITGWSVQLFYYRKKVICLNGDKSLRKIKGGAMIISNHTSIYDYPLVMYTFLGRTIRTLVAEIMYQKNKFVSKLLVRIGSIRVDRTVSDFGFLGEMIDCLKRGQLGLIYPESRIPKENEKGTLLEFKPSYVYIALNAKVPIVPVYTNGIYGKLKRKYKNRSKIVIGEKINVNDLYDESKTEKENINYINDYVKNKVLELKQYLEEHERKKEN